MGENVRNNREADEAFRTRKVTLTDNLPSIRLGPFLPLDSGERHPLVAVTSHVSGSNSTTKIELRGKEIITITLTELKV